MKKTKLFAVPPRGFLVKNAKVSAPTDRASVASPASPFDVDS